MSTKPLLWVGTALADVRRFPAAARRRAGHELRLLQHGLMPSHFKPMPSVGQGVSEIRIRAGGAFRVFYVARFEEGIYVLHAFEKQSRRTARLDVEIGALRYREVIASRRP
jgi:phage-related protein